MTNSDLFLHKQEIIEQCKIENDNTNDVEKFIIEMEEIQSIFKKFDSKLILNSTIVNLTNELVEVSFKREEGNFDEWVAIAATVDRNCFIFYFVDNNEIVKKYDFSMMVSSTIINEAISNFIKENTMFSRYFKMINQYGWDKAVINCPSFYLKFIELKNSLIIYVKNEMMLFLEKFTTKFLLDLENVNNFIIYWKIKN